MATIQPSMSSTRLNALNPTTAVVGILMLWSFMRHMISELQTSSLMVGWCICGRVFSRVFFFEDVEYFLW